MERVNVIAMAKCVTLMMRSSPLACRRRPDYVAAGGGCVGPDHVAVGALDVAAPRHVIFVFLAHLHPPVQEEVGVVGGPLFVEGGCELLAGNSPRRKVRGGEGDESGLVL